MAVTRSWTAAGTAPVMVRAPRSGATVRFAWLVVSSLMVAAGLGFVYQAKVQRMSGAAVVNVNAVRSAEEPIARSLRSAYSGTWSGRGRWGMRGR
jgi:hypothetical protein